MPGRRNRSRRHQTFVVGERACARGESAEAAFEIAQRNHAESRDGPPGRRDIVSLEMLREPFVQPRRDASRRNGRDHRVRQLVHQHALEQLRALRRAGRRHADAAVIHAARPRRRLRHVAKLLFGVQHDDDRL